MTIEVYESTTEDGMFLFSTLECAKRSWILTYCKTNKLISFDNEYDLDKNIIVLSDGVVVGSINRRLLRDKPEHL